MLHAISPLDDRYHEQLSEVAHVFSEYTLMQYRLKIEIEYLIALGNEKTLPNIPPLSAHNQHEIRKLYGEFNTETYKRIKEIESTVRHDVKAIEYYIREKLINTPLSSYIPFVHFGLTSEDINNLSYTLMWKDGLHTLYLPLLKNIFSILSEFIHIHKHEPMLALTHGQPATSTTIGKEYAVFFARLQRQFRALTNHHFSGKLNGATGTWAAHVISYPTCDWITFSKQFVTALGLEPNVYTTQVEGRDTLVESYQAIFRINNILLGLCQDTWMYISRGILKLKKHEEEVGSSTMPHKINPIHFENAEGNIGLANALFSFFSKKLPVSRMQRDLSDSTVLRNQGVALAHSILAAKQILHGLKKIAVDAHASAYELNQHYEILGEAIQSILRKNGIGHAYELVKEKTRGNVMNKEEYMHLVASLPIPQEDKDELLNLTPHSYIGLAATLADMITH